MKLLSSYVQVAAHLVRFEPSQRLAAPHSLRNRIQRSNQSRNKCKQLIVPIKKHFHCIFYGKAFV